MKLPARTETPMKSNIIRMTPWLLTALLAVTACEEKTEPAKDKTAETPSATAKATSTAAAKVETPKDQAAGGAVASAHLAKDCEVVARIDVTGLLGAAPVKDNLVPALEEAKSKEAKDDGQKSFKAFLAESGIDPLKDIKEVALCVKGLAGGKKTTTFALIASGNLKADSVVPAMLKTAKDKDKLKEIEVAGIKALTNDKGDMFMGQAKDGVFVVAMSKEAFEGALGTSDAASTMKLPTDRTIAVVAPAAALKAAMADFPGDNPLKAHMDKIERVLTSVDVATSMIETRITMTDDKAPAELGGVLKLMLQELAKKPARGPDAMVMAMLKDAKFDYQGKDMVVTVKLPMEQLSALAKQGAEQIRSELK
jgi:hypothetical protein